MKVQFDCITHREFIFTYAQLKWSRPYAWTGITIWNAQFLHRLTAVHFRPLSSSARISMDKLNHNNNFITLPRLLRVETDIHNAVKLKTTASFRNFQKNSLICSHHRIKRYGRRCLLALALYQFRMANTCRLIF